MIWSDLCAIAKNPLQTAYLNLSFPLWRLHTGPYWTREGTVSYGFRYPRRCVCGFLCLKHSKKFRHNTSAHRKAFPWTEEAEA